MAPAQPRTHRLCTTALLAPGTSPVTTLVDHASILKVNTMTRQLTESTARESLTTAKMDTALQNRTAWLAPIQVPGTVMSTTIRLSVAKRATIWSKASMVQTNVSSIRTNQRTDVGLLSLSHRRTTRAFVLKVLMPVGIPSRLEMVRLSIRNPPHSRLSLCFAREQIIATLAPVNSDQMPLRVMKQRS